MKKFLIAFLRLSVLFLLAVGSVDGMKKKKKSFLPVSSGSGKNVISDAIEELDESSFAPVSGLSGGMRNRISVSDPTVLTVRGDMARGAEIAYHLSFASDDECKKFMRDIFRKSKGQAKKRKQAILDFLTYCYQLCMLRTEPENMPKDVVLWFDQDPTANRVYTFLQSYCQEFRLPVLKNDKRKSKRDSMLSMVSQEDRLRPIILNFDEGESKIGWFGEVAQTKRVYFRKIITRNYLLEKDDEDKDIVRTCVVISSRPLRKISKEEDFFKQLQSKFKGILQKVLKDKKSEKAFEFCWKKKRKSVFKLLSKKDKDERQNVENMRQAALLFLEICSEEKKGLIINFLKRLDSYECQYKIHDMESCVIENNNFLNAVELYFDKHLPKSLHESEISKEIDSMEEEDEGEEEEEGESKERVEREDAVDHQKVASILKSISGLLSRLREKGKDGIDNVKDDLVKNLRALGRCNISDELLCKIGICIFDILDQYDVLHALSFDQPVAYDRKEIEFFLENVKQVFRGQAKNIFGGMTEIFGKEVEIEGEKEEIRKEKFKEELRIVEQELEGKIKDLFEGLKVVLSDEDLEKLDLFQKTFIDYIKKNISTFSINLRMASDDFDIYKRQFGFILNSLRYVINDFITRSHCCCSTKDEMGRNFFYKELTRRLSAKFAFCCKFLRNLGDKGKIWEKRYKMEVGTLMEEFKDMWVCSFDKIMLYKLYFEEARKKVRQVNGCSLITIRERVRFKD